MAWQHDQLANDLANHLAGKSGRMIWTDMQLGPSGSARPDVYTIEPSFVSPRPTSYEIKISRSDFMSDVGSGKWQKYLEFSGAVVFAVPAGLVDKREIPDRCGLIVRGETGWRTARRATVSPVTLPQSVMLKLLIDGVDRSRARRQLEPRSATRWSLAADRRKELGKEVADALRDVDRYRADAEVYLNQAKQRRREAEGIVQAERDRAQEIIADLSKELCDVIGLEKWNAIHARQKINQLRADVSADARVQRVEEFLARARQSVRQANNILEAVSEARQ